MDGFKEDIVEELLRRLAEGESLRSICRDARMPEPITVRRWARQDDELAERILDARESGFHDRAERAVEEARTCKDPVAGRLAFDAERWYLGKLSRAFAEKPIAIGALVNVDAGDAFAAVAGALEVASAAISSGRDRTITVDAEGKAGPAHTPGDWPIWLALAGRGWGKTRTGAEDVTWFGVQNAGSRIAIIAPTFQDARDTCVEGESGLLATLPSACIEAWNRSLGELILFNGSRYKLFSAAEPERLRGPQHHRAWGDEVAAWPDPAAWDQMLFGLRLGRHPQVIATTTPKPTPLIRKIVRTAGAMITRGSTFDNSQNLPEGTLAHLRDRYEGTRLGRQELFAELLEDVAGALWTAGAIDERRIRGVPDLARIVVAVDPSGTKGDGQGDDVGIVVAGKGTDGRFYVLEDASCNLSPGGWAKRVAQAYERWAADRVVAERNFGGAMVEAVLRTAAKDLPVKMVTATRGKVVRAEPVAALYEQGKVSHVGEFNEMETQLCAMTASGYVGEGSPDRADALVWALTELCGRGYNYDLTAALAE